MESSAIPNSSITASTHFRPFDGRYPRLPQYARFHSDRRWSSAYWDPQPWIQADLGCIHNVTGLKTSGVWVTHEWSYWVEKIKMKIGMSENSLVFIKDSNGDSKVSET